MIDQLIIDREDSIRSALSKIDENSAGIVFVTENMKLIGSFSDGDCRRALLNNATLDDSVKLHMNLKPIFAKVGIDSESLNELFKGGVAVIPLINERGLIEKFLTPTSGDYLPLSEPNLGKREFQFVYEALTSNWISSTGPFVEKFERSFTEITKLENTLSVCNGTQALFLSLYTLGIRPGDEVIVPDLTFGATANAVIQAGATPVFCDIDRATWCLDLGKLKSVITSRTRAVIPVHLYGYPVEMKQLMKLAEENNLIVIEDCAEALGSRIDGLHVGSFGHAAIFSFFANKTITTGEGGMVVFRDSEYLHRGQKIRSHGFRPGDRYSHEEWGSNFRLTNLQAAIGMAQLERFHELVDHKIRIANIYNFAFKNSGIKDLEIPPQSTNNLLNSYWLYTVLLPHFTPVNRVIEYLAREKIESRRVFKPMHQQPAFLLNRDSRYFESFFGNSIEISNRGLSLPSSTRLTDAQVERVARKLIEFVLRY
jgi:perosamine synthetase